MPAGLPTPISIPSRRPRCSGRCRSSCWIRWGRSRSRPAYLLPMLPWLARLVLASRPSNLERSVEALRGVAAPRNARLGRLSSNLGLTRMIHKRGGLFVFETRRPSSAASPISKSSAPLASPASRRRVDELRQMEPGLSRAHRRGAFFPDAAHVTDPRLLTEALFAAAMTQGRDVSRGAAVASVEAGRLPAITASTTGTSRTPSRRDRGRRVVEAARGGPRRPVPLETERGYNTTLPTGAFDVKRPVIFPGPRLRHHAAGHGPARRRRGRTAAARSGRPTLARSQAMLQKAKRFLPRPDPPWTGTRMDGFSPVAAGLRCR